MKIEYWDKFLVLLDNNIIVNKLNSLKTIFINFINKNDNDIFFIYLIKNEDNSLKIFIKFKFDKDYKYIYNIEKNKVISLI